jgi:TP901 family phage tail tape measure protein
MTDLGFGITLALKDLFTKNAGKIEQSYKSLDGTIATASDSINKNMERVQKGAMLVGAGLATLAIPAALAASTMASQKALGEMRSLGIKDLAALAQAAEYFSNRWSGTTKAEFIAASYDIKSGIASLSDFAVGEYTKLAALTAKATKSTTAEMTSLFATGFGIYKMMYAGISDIAFGEMFAGGIAAAVQAFKTTGSGMAESISRLGAIATTAKIPLEEQLAILGMLQATMPGSEAGTKYKAFMKSAAKAGGELGLQFTDSKNQLLGMVSILNILREKYGETLDAMEKQEIQKAFGRVEAVEVVDLFYDRIGNLTGNIENMNQAMKKGTTLTQKMALAMNIDMGAQLKLVRQQLHNLFEILGNTLLPIVTPVIQGISSIIMVAQRLAKTFPGVTKVVLGTTLAIGGLLVTGGILLMGLGALGLAIPAANTALAAFGITATITGASIKAALLSAFWPITIGIAVIYALKKAWDNNLGGIQNKVAAFWHTVSTIWNGISALISSGKVSEALHNELQRMGLWSFVKSIYMVYYRLSQFFSGVHQQIKSAFSALGEAFYPIFSTIYGIVAPVGKLLFSLAQALGLVGSAVPSSAFMAFGQVIGWLVGTPLKMLAWGIKLILAPINLLGKFVGMVLNLISAIPEFLLPKGIEGLKKQLTAGSLAMTLAATPAIAAEKPDNLHQARLLAEKNTYYYQTFNNQRAESNTITQAPVISPDQRPLEVKLNLDGREIYRSMVNQEREYGVRNSG